MSRNLVAYYPMFFVIGYISISLLLSISGPIGYVNYQKLPTIFFVSMTLVFFAIGYFIGLNDNIRVSTRFSSARMDVIVPKVFQICIILAALSTLVIFLKAAASGTLSLNIATSGEAYFAGYEGYERNTGTYSIDFLISSFTAFPVFLTMIWGIYYFRSFPYRRKILLLSIIGAIIIVFTISGGKQKQFGDFIIYFLTLNFIGAIIGKRFKLKSFFVIGIILFGGLMTLLALLSSRYAVIGVNASNLNSVIHPMMFFIEDHPIINILGPDVGFSFSVFTSYLGQGFYGLSLSLEQDFTWTSFGGSSYSWSVILNRFLGLPFMVEQSYPYIVGDTTGWAQTKWHSVYAWLASDFTFFGTVLLNGVIGYVFAQLWKEITLFENPFSILFFCLLCVGAFYAPANNQLMHTPGGLFTLILTAWVYYRYRASYNFHSLTSKTQ